MGDANVGTLSEPKGVFIAWCVWYAPDSRSPPYSEYCGAGYAVSGNGAWYAPVSAGRLGSVRRRERTGCAAVTSGGPPSAPCVRLLHVPRSREYRAVRDTAEWAVPFGISCRARSSG